MITKLRALLLPFLVACPAAHAVDPEGPGVAANPNHFFFHPIVTVISAASDKIPLVLAVTYERNLASPGNSLVWKPELILGDAKDGDVGYSQIGTSQYLGLRHYFGTEYRGFYLQGSGAFAFSSVSAKQDGNPNEASGTVNGIGGLGYLGYRWSHVYWDGGIGYQGGKGDLTFDDGQEISITDNGLLFDFSLGFGF